MPQEYFGFPLLVLAVLCFLGGLRISYETEAGSLGQVPVLAYAVGPPFLAVAGLAMVDSGLGWPGAPWWAYPLAWLSLMYLAGVAIIKVGEWGARRHRAAAEDT
jgi:hypothetical protein